MKILLVEDDEPTAQALKEALGAHHYIVTIATDGQTGLELAQAFTYDLLMLDVLLPKVDGIAVCRYLRSTGYQRPILLLTALDNSTDRVMGLDAGADDYLVKPCDMEELMARIRALLRRRSSTLPPVIIWGELRFDSSTNEFSYGGNVLRLTAKEYSLLELFLLHPRRVYSRSAVIDHLWPDEKYPEENTVTSHIKSLRKKLKAAGATADLIETLHGVGYRLKPSPDSDKPTPLSMSQIAGEIRERKELSQQQMINSVSKLWEKFRGTFTAQIEVLEQASTALLDNRLTLQFQQNAKREAHRLAGSLGIFGFAEGSTLARRLEHLLETEKMIGQEQALELSELVGQLQHELRKPPSVSKFETAPVSNSDSLSSRMLVIDDDVALTQWLKSESAAWNIQVDVVLDLKAAREAIASTPPNIILLDLTFPDPIENGLTLLAELASHTHQIPVVAFTGRDSLSVRLEVARLGCSAFLHKPASIEQIFKTVTQVLDRTRTVEAKIMVVDDDPIVLATLHHLLSSWGINVTTLKNSQIFWDVFSSTAPDLLILDLEMPGFSGIDLCQVVRNDPQWSDLPILFLTAHTETDAVNRAFAAGADDYISKPFVEQELVTRIVKRLKPIRSRQNPS
jgi:DNA-binding response OmpR family regulator